MFGANDDGTMYSQDNIIVEARVVGTELNAMYSLQVLPEVVRPRPCLRLLPADSVCAAVSFVSQFVYCYLVPGQVILGAEAFLAVAIWNLALEGLLVPHFVFASP